MSSFPFIPQKNHDGCAIAVLTMVCHYFGISLKYNQIDSVFKNRNLNLKEIGEYLKSNKIKSKPFIVETKDIRKLINFPLILHYQNHFVVAYKRVNDYVFIADPATIGIRKVNILKVKRLWSGYGLDLSENIINPLINFEKHLPYNLRLIIINIILILGILLIIN